MKILKFSASWCGPCKALSHNISTLSAEDQEKFEEYDVDTCDKALLATYNVRAVPTMVVISDKGSLLKIVTGAQSIPKLRELLELQ